MYDYDKDPVAQRCLALAKNCKSHVGFGAVLLDSDNRIIGEGWNRRSVLEERQLLTHVDYAIHAEQACIFDSLTKSNQGLENCKVFVLGVVLIGQNKGTLTHRKSPGFGCWKCPHTLIKYSVPVNVTLDTGWVEVTPNEALIFGLRTKNSGLWKNFAQRRGFAL